MVFHKLNEERKRCKGDDTTCIVKQKVNNIVKMITKN